MSAGRGAAHARAALLGNPSDAYGGRTIAFTIAGLRAEVEIEALTAGEGEPAVAVDPPAAGPLVSAAVARLHRARPEIPGVAYRARWRSNIPREVGLAGSSAIVVATLRALCSLHAVAVAPDELAALALAAEVEELGIAAGPQDRVVQARQGLVSMDFAPGGEHTALDPALLPPLYLAHRTRASVPSGAVHGELRARHAAGEPAVVSAMAELAGLARAGHDALLRGAGERELAALIDANFAVRRGLLALDREDARMVEVARSQGASAHFAGSGGAVVGTLGAATLDGLRQAFAGHGCAVIAPVVAGGVTFAGPASSPSYSDRRGREGG